MDVLTFFLSLNSVLVDMGFYLDVGYLVYFLNVQVLAEVTMALALFRVAIRDGYECYVLRYLSA